jgi:molecular chaperone DnaK
MTERVLGIDLGTTNSCVAVVESGTPLVVPVDKGFYTLPSVVARVQDGKHLVGRLAKRQAVVNAENTVFAAKRLIGRDFADTFATRAMQSSPFHTSAGPDGDIRIELGDRAAPHAYAVQEISAIILGELKAAAEAYFGEPVSKAVITVPAYFTDRQRQATIDAGRIAGLEVLRIINEPTAAALAYGALQSGDTRRIAVYDLGGGTFDVSVLAISTELVEVLATAGDAFLGGRDFDDRVLEWLLALIEREHGVSVGSDRNAMQRLRDAAEAAKIELSDNTTAKIALPFLATRRDGQPLHVQCELDRSQYEAMVNDYVDRTIGMFVGTIAQAGLGLSQVDEIILVGGMTRTPKIQRRVSEAVGKTPSSGVHADLVVAVGAAIQGALLTSGQPGLVLMDVTPHNLGIMAFGGLAETVIPKDTTIPTEFRRIFTTVQDNQEQVRIIVYQGDARHIGSNEVLGEFTLQGIAPRPRGGVHIEVAFSISADGIVSVSARDMETGREQAIQVTGRHRLQEDEIKRMISDHQENLLAAIAEGEAVPGEVARQLIESEGAAS